MMVGRPVELTSTRTPHSSVTRRSSSRTSASSTLLGHVHLDDISFTIKAGEVLAVAGVQGNGQTELTEALLGLQDHVEGSIKLDGKELVGRSVRQHPRRRRRVHPRGPPGRRPGRRLLHRREPHAQPQLPVARSCAAARCASTRSRSSPRRSSRSTTSARPTSTPRRQAVRRQPAEGRRRPRALARPAPARGRPADARRRRRLHRVHPQADRGDPRQRRPRPGRLHRARRGRRPRRPDHGALPRAGGRHRARRHPARDPRTDDDRRAPEGVVA